MSYFSIDCRDCPRLASFLDDVKAQHPDYHARPVPPFGSESARALIVGLAPGMHGANATGRPFTGDYAGVLLYKALFQYGFSNQEEATAIDDGLKLVDCRITNAVKCLPPENKPNTSEIKQCNHYLAEEIQALPQGSVIFTLGSIAHNAVLRALQLKLSQFPFGHGAEYDLPGSYRLISSYHCSRYNTQTKRLTEEMFMAVVERVRKYIESE